MCYLCLMGYDKWNLHENLPDYDEDTYVFELPVGTSSVVPQANSNCEHEWVNVGLTHDKWVCKKCNIDRGY